MLNILKNRIITGFAQCARIIGAVSVLGLGLLGAGSVQAAGLLSPKDGSPELILAEQHVSVVIENGFATTEIDQIFRNPYATDKDATYSFPVPKDAAVGEFTFWIDGVPVHAEVLEKKAARQLHEQQQQQGLDSALVEQDGHRTFDMEVSPVRANQDVRVRLVYLQQNPVDHSMGRYVYPLEDGGVDEEANKFWTRNEEVSDAFSFKLRLRSAYPVDAMRVTNGQGSISQIDSGEWELLIDSQSGSGAAVGAGLTNGEINYKELQSSDAISGSWNPNATASSVYSLNKDIVVYWRLNENLPGAVDLVTYKDENSSSGTFMLTLTPGIDLAPIVEGRDWVFVLDTSGSMNGKFNTLLDGLERSLRSLGETDRYQVVLFSDTAKSLSGDLTFATKENIDQTLNKLDRYEVGGGTNLYDGLRVAIENTDADRTSAIVLVTDGVANVGQTEMTEFLKLIEQKDVRVFTAVMGNNSNRPLLEGLTRHAEGFAVSVSNQDDMLGLMMQVVSKVTHEAMHNINISIDGVRTRDLTPDQYTRVYRGEQLIVMGKYSGAGEASVTLTADISGMTKQYKSVLNFPDVETDNPELERLWAFATIKDLLHQQDLFGETDDTRDGITGLALTHGLVTDYTSLIAVRESAFEAAGIDRANSERIIREREAREKRLSSSIGSNRQDNNNPAFSQNRPVASPLGGGSVGYTLFLMLLFLCVVRLAVNIYDALMRKRYGKTSEQ